MNKEAIEIIFEDESLIVCIKPFGLASQSDIKGSANMVSLLGELTGSPVFPVHRLDRETGGIMVFARTSASAAALGRQITENRFKKEYIALVHGRPNEEEGIFEDLLFKDSSRNKSYVVRRERKGVRRAVLEYKTLNSRNGMTAVKVLLKTGRTHQIRVQFSFRGMPLAGDKKYGGKDDFKQLGLWSYSLEFIHPMSGQNLYFSREPESFIKEYIDF